MDGVYKVIGIDYLNAVYYYYKVTYIQLELDISGFLLRVTTPNLVNTYSLSKALYVLSDIRNRPHPRPTSMDGRP